MKKMPNLALNIRHLCANVGSYASVCREIGLNQQQFSKYINGTSRPSAYNLRRIAQFFDVEDSDLDMAHDAFLTRTERAVQRTNTKSRDGIAMAFPGDLHTLRNFVGTYQVYYTSPAVPDQIVVSAMVLHEQDGIVYTRSLEALRAEGEQRRQWTRCDGKAAFFTERLFVVDFEAENGGALSMTTLIPPHRYRRGIIFGMTFFLASHPRRVPHTSRVAWKRMENHISIKEVLQGCGSVPVDSRYVHPAVRRYLSDANLEMAVAPPFQSLDNE